VETQNVQLDALGRYSVLLGVSLPGGLPLDLFTTGKALWLGVQAQLPGQAEQPRVLLVAVPYALKGTNRQRMLGAVVGKALEPLGKGTGVIQVLVKLQ
jgi:hypothetical protein